MKKFDIDNYINSQKCSNNINLDDFPEIDLYMDQVMQLFENKLSYTKRYDDDKVLTKTMINNYAKGKLLMKIKNKKYSKNHLILMGLIYNLKGGLSLSDIKTTLTPIISDFEDGKDYPLYDVYKLFLDIYSENLDTVQHTSHEIQDNVENLIKNSNSNLGDFEEQFLSICAFISMSNLYRRMAEKIIDNCLMNSKENK